MQFEEFIGRVQVQARLKRDESISISQAVLETLGERLDRKVRNGLEAQLPKELKDFLLARHESTDRYNLSEFYNRVGARADLKHGDTIERTKQVLSVFRQAIPEGELQDMAESLPREYGELFDKELYSH